MFFWMQTNNTSTYIMWAVLHVYAMFILRNNLQIKHDFE